MRTGNDMSKTNKMLAAAAMVMCLAPAMTWAAENDSDEGARHDMVCAMAGGAPSVGSDWRSCCWNSYCYICYDDGICEIVCKTEDCCDLNFGCYTIIVPDDVYSEPEDDPEGRPGRPNLDQLNINDGPVVASSEGQGSPVAVSEARLNELILEMGPDVLPGAFEPGGAIEETEEDEPNGDLDNETGEDGSVTPAEICGAGGGASLMFGLMGLVGMQNRNRRRRTGTAQGETNGRTY